MSNSDKGPEMGTGRCSAHASKGTGGQLAQMQALEQIQTERSV